MSNMYITIAIVYLVGFLLCYWMLRVDHESEGQPYTTGARLFNVLFSLLSWLMIIIDLIVSWYGKIKKTGYWNKPVKNMPE